MFRFQELNLSARTAPDPCQDTLRVANREFAHSINTAMLEQALKFFVVFFVVVEPVSLIPMFTGLTAGATAAYKRRMVCKAALISAAILLL
ncbi:MAG: hypothetical protein JO173_09620, partial [Gammaproteobacteria bacterium]|nr:hypothetical protein [Gammaproteobacteria bacterium]